MFVAGGLAWGIPLLIASGGLNAYLAALGTQAGEDFAAGEMLYLNPNPRAAAFALLRTFVHPWDSTVARRPSVLVLAAAGLVQLLWRDRRSLAAVIAIAGPYLVFHLLFQDTSFIRYALPLVPVVAFLAVRGVSLVSAEGGAGRGRARLDRRRRDRQSGARAHTARSRARRCARCAPCRPKRWRRRRARWRCTRRSCGRSKPKTSAITPQLPSPPRLEWLELVEVLEVGQHAADLVSRRSDAQRSRADRSGEPAGRRPSITGRSSRARRLAACGRRPCAGIACRRPDGLPKKAGR